MRAVKDEIDDILTLAFGQIRSRIYQMIDEAQNTIDDVPIEELQLSARSRNGLLNHGVRSVRQLMAMSDREILSITQIGRTSLMEIREELDYFNEDRAAAVSSGEVG